MTRFHLGDEVCLDGLPNSEWRDSHGRVVEVTEYAGRGGEQVQECCVLFKDQRRWFLASNLIKTISPRFSCLFRGEVADRWKLDPDQVARLNGNREQLVQLLIDEHGFAARRANAEADEFLAEFRKRLERAIEIVPPQARSASAAGAAHYIAARRGAA